MRKNQKIFIGIVVSVAIIIILGSIYLKLEEKIEEKRAYDAAIVDAEYKKVEYEGDKPKAGEIKKDKNGIYKYKLEDNQVLGLERNENITENLEIYNVDSKEIVFKEETIGNVSTIFDNKNDVTGISIDGTSYRLTDSEIRPFSKYVNKIYDSPTGDLYLKDKVLYYNGDSIAREDCRNEDKCLNSDIEVLQKNNEIIFETKEDEIWKYNVETEKYEKIKMEGDYRNWKKIDENIYSLKSNANTKKLEVNKLVDGKMEKIETDLYDDLEENETIEDYKVIGNKLYVKTFVMYVYSYEFGEEPTDEYLKEPTDVYEIDMKSGKYKKIYTAETTFLDWYLNSLVCSKHGKREENYLYNLQTGDEIVEEIPYFSALSDIKYNMKVINLNGMNISPYIEVRPEEGK